MVGKRTEDVAGKNGKITHGRWHHLDPLWNADNEEKQFHNKSLILRHLRTAVQLWLIICTAQYPFLPGDQIQMLQKDLVSVWIIKISVNILNTELVAISNCNQQTSHPKCGCITFKILQLCFKRLSLILELRTNNSLQFFLTTHQWWLISKSKCVGIQASWKTTLWPGSHATNSRCLEQTFVTQRQLVMCGKSYFSTQYFADSWEHSESYWENITKTSVHTKQGRISVLSMCHSSMERSHHLSTSKTLKTRSHMFIIPLQRSSPCNPVQDKRELYIHQPAWIS